MMSGLGHIVREKTILGALTLDALAVLFGGATALLPIFADEILKAGPIAFGALRAATPVGAILMTIVLTMRPRISPAGPLLFASVAAYGLCMIGFGFSTNLALSLLLLVASGAADNVSVVVRHVLVQTRTPNHIRGRVSAVNGVFIECSNELGAFESGLVARLFTPVISVVSGGIGTLIVVAITARSFPALRRLREIREITPPLESETTPIAGTTAR
ncbi:MAG: MFS transporter [Phycisphaerae bacterium]|nr:MFS transporter [Phycisphaerae bacterium]